MVTVSDSRVFSVLFRGLLIRVCSSTQLWTDQLFLEPSRCLSQAMNSCMYADSCSRTLLHREKREPLTGEGDWDFITKSSEKLSQTKQMRRPADNGNNKTIAAETVAVKDSSVLM
ncbi:hypothetical protein CDAR_509851 [Caerostris darwini]|uniref:Uncharacterized protein n=1 Tax=Caerostris darwini TaxID=1538125 RepID=A0AAV4S8E6_9ARAC|nr:hypothetical protein CDAR_509851 [Caerostris darwini]